MPEKEEKLLGVCIRKDRREGGKKNGGKDRSGSKGKSSTSCTVRFILLARGVTMRMLIDQPYVLVAN